MMNTRFASVFIATAIDVRPLRRGSPPPLISFQVTPLSVDLYRKVAVAAPPPPAPPAGGGLMPDGGNGAV
jgi:hypothetical protein